MTSSEPEKGYEYFKGLVPLFVRGVLPEADSRTFKEAVQRYPRLNEEIRSWKDVDSAYRELATELPKPSPAAFGRVMARVEKKRNFFERLMPSPAVSFAVVVAQFLVIVGLGLYGTSFRGDFKTLSAPSFSVERKASINVVFNEQATEGEIRRLLVELDATIVNGPRASGLYVIALSSSSEVEKTLSLLRQNKNVVLAERAY